MSATALQRVVVRMHHDPTFVAEVYADAEAALRGVDVTVAERAMLLRADRRAWGVDPARRDRVFEALRREYPVACGLAERAVGSRDPLLAFFRAKEFHDCIQDRGLLADAFGAWLSAAARRGRFGKSATAESCVVERAAVAVRRARDVPPGPGLVRSPRVRVVEVRRGTLALVQAVFAAWTADGRIPAPPRLRKGAEHICVEGDAGGAIALGTVPGALAHLLATADEPRAEFQLYSAAERLGADPGDGPEIVASLVADGLLVRA